MIDYIGGVGTARIDFGGKTPRININTEHEILVVNGRDMIAQRRDNNEDEIIEAARARGWAVIQMDKSAGFDLLIVTPFGNHIVEVKNPARKWQLEPAEQKRKDEVEKAGGRYNIVLYPEFLNFL